MNRQPLVIVGAGPAGMSAAIAATEAGLRPLVLDENSRVGGQVYRQPPDNLPSQASPNASARRGALLLRRFRELSERMTVLTDATVWGIFPNRMLAVSHGDSWDMIAADELVLAPGAYEYVPPFPGWTLPGVMTPGAAQVLAKTMHVLPGKRALVAGTGPFLLVVAEQLHRAGMQIAGVVDAVPTRAWMRAVPRMLNHIGLLAEGLAYLHRLNRARVPIERGTIVIAARGEGAVQEAVLAPCDSDWRPDRNRTRSVAVDTLLVGYGFVPRMQLAQLAGCRFRYADELGGWIPDADEDMQTSVPGLAVAGDGGGVAGALVAEDEGTLAGMAAAHRLGALSGAAFTSARAPIVRRLRRLRRFRAAFDELSRIRRGLNDLADAETIVCRCEEVTRAEAETALRFGGCDIRTLKVMNRLGMGPCQGRMCWPAAARWLADRTGKSPEEIGPLSARPPIQPVCLGDLALGQSSEIAHRS